MIILKFSGKMDFFGPKSLRCLRFLLYLWMVIALTTNVDQTPLSCHLRSAGHTHEDLHNIVITIIDWNNNWSKVKESLRKAFGWKNYTQFLQMEWTIKNNSLLGPSWKLVQHYAIHQNTALLQFIWFYKKIPNKGGPQPPKHSYPGSTIIISKEAILNCVLKIFKWWQ